MSSTNDLPLSPRRPRTQRPDTAASGISEDDLPRQQFFPEGSSDEDGEGEDDDKDDDVFAFSRPVTAGQPSGPTLAGYGTAPVVARPTTARPVGAEDVSADIGTSTGPGTSSYGVTPLRITYQSVNVNKDTVPTPTGVIDIGGHLPENKYDRENPPPFSGKNNPNNSSFAFVMGGRGHLGKRPRTGQSFLEKLRRREGRKPWETSVTMTRGLNVADDEFSISDATSYAGGSEYDQYSVTGRPRNHDKNVMSVSYVSEAQVPSDGGDINKTYTNRGLSRASIGLTELTGEMTVPDGKTTWGNGMLGAKSDDHSMADIEMDMIDEDSPYPEVRASVSNIDDLDMPALTIRAWVLGLFFTVLSSAFNTYFHFRTPAPYISPLIVQVVAYPVGKFFAWLLPINTYRLPRWLGGIEFSLNPGPFNIKEHTIIVMMANVAIGPAYALYAIVSSELYYHHSFGFGFAIMFLFATQMTGFTMAGICRRFVVWPASMIWPANLVVATNLNTFHAEEDGFTSGMSRFKFLILCGCGAFVWYFFPGFLFTALSYFSWVCWIAPNNNIVNELFGVSTGLGMSILTFDWTQITWIGNPLTTPWWAEVNIGLGFLLFYWILTPILYYNNVWQTAYLPISVIQAADRFGSAYNIFNILTLDITLNKTAYAEYSPVYLSASFSVTFMVAFALSTAIIVHTILYHGPRIYRAIINVKTEVDDIHLKLMKMYPEVPDWWFLALFVFVFVMAVIALEVYHTGLPIWGYVISILLPFVYVIPAAFIYAMTSQQVAINLLAELVPGYIFQGQPLPGMIFKVFSVQTIVEALSFIQDQKLGHYMKVPPRATFIAQLSATGVACFVQSGVKELLFHIVKDICQAGQKSLLTCASTKTFFTSSIIWGLIGPQRLFSKGSLYYPQVYALLLGALLPIPLWIWVRKYPRSIFRNMNFPVMFSGALAIPPASGINYASWILTGFIFQFWLRRRRFAWWSKYNYVLSAALDVGTAISAIVLFLFLGLPGASLNWWGTNVHKKTVDWNGDGATFKIAPPEGFGPNTWKV
nr:OPT family small oligopeptide transporter [Cryptococcus depauperatus CBS 7841]